MKKTADEVITETNRLCALQRTRETLDHISDTLRNAGERYTGDYVRGMRNVLIGEIIAEAKRLVLAYNEQKEQA